MKTIEEKLAVMRGWLEGKPVQYQTPGGTWVNVANPVWQWAEGVDYRIKPEPAPKRRVPLEPEDLPVVCWVREPFNPFIYLVVGIGSHYIRIVGNSSTKDKQLHDLVTLNWEYSPDRKNWKPMWKEVE